MQSKKDNALRVALVAAVVAFLLAFMLLFGDAAQGQTPSATHTPTPTAGAKDCPGGGLCHEDIEINFLSSSQDIGDTDSFKVRAYDLFVQYRYKIELKAQGTGNKIGFNSSCTKRSDSVTLPANVPTYNWSRTLYACASGTSKGGVEANEQQYGARVRPAERNGGDAYPHGYEHADKDAQAN